MSEELAGVELEQKEEQTAKHRKRQEEADVAMFGAALGSAAVGPSQHHVVDLVVVAHKYQEVKNANSKEAEDKNFKFQRIV